jgi:hypothetical protein
LDARLRRRCVHQLGVLSLAQLLDFVPRVSRGDEHLAALVRSLARYFDAGWHTDASVLRWLEAL